MALTGAWMAGGNPSREERVKDDFYATPGDCTEALLLAENRVPELIWEPACGDGAICKVLTRYKTNFVASDIIDRGFPDTHVASFFSFETSPFGAQKIITNPPFALAEPFIHHAHSLGIEYMALLLKATFWHAAKRERVWEKWRPARIYAMTWRPDFRNWGSPTMDCVWCVWDGRDNLCDPEYKRLKKPC